MKHISLKVILTLALALFLSPFCLRAQNAKSSASTPAQTKLVLDVKQMATDQDAQKISEVLSSAPGKILSYTIDKNTRQVTVFISPDLQVVDLLEVLDIAGYKAGYLDEQNGEYVRLESTGHLDKQPYTKKQ